MGYGKGCLLTLAADKGLPKRAHPCAKCIVKWPCCCCWVSLLLAIAATIIGIVSIVRGTDPDAATGPLKSALNYPVNTEIALQMDSLTLALDRSEKALSAHRIANAASGRRELATALAQGKEHSIVEQIFFSITGYQLQDFQPAQPSTAAFFGVADQQQDGSNRRLQSTTLQYQQEHSLTAASFIFESRAEDGNVFDDDGLEQMCSLHASMTSHADFPDYCLKRLDPSVPFNASEPDNRVTMCSIGFSPLAFFYGPPSYDIDTIDPAVFAWPNIRPIIRALAEGDIVTSTATVTACFMNSQSTCTLANGDTYDMPELLAISLLIQKLYTYYATHWLNSYITSGINTCRADYKKNTANVLAVIGGIRSVPELDSLLGGLLNYYFDASFSAANPKSRYSRATVSYGGPLSGFSDILSDSQQTKQENEFSTWYLRVGKFKDYYKGDTKLWPTIKPTGMVFSMLLQELLLLLILDGVLAILPIVLVFVIVWLQTRSLFIAIITLTEMILAFTASLFVTATILQIQWLAFEIFLGLYIVLAIGADDVFVFMDAYKQSFFRGPEVNADLTSRMSWVYRRAGLAMFITSFTTAFAFVATAAASPLPSLQLFGIFAASVILVDYLLVMTLLCSACVIYHNLFERKAGLCCACCTCFESGSTMDYALCNANKYGGCNNFCEYTNDEPLTTQLAREGSVETKEVEKNGLVRFFEDTWPFSMVVKPVPIRALSILAFLAIIGPAAYGAAQLTPQTSPENFLPDDHPFQRFITLSSEFKTSDEDTTVAIQVVWGVDTANPIVDATNRLFSPDEKDWGNPNYAPFVLDTTAQLALLQVCDLLENSYNNNTDTYNVKRIFDITSGNTTVEMVCFMRKFRDYRVSEGLPFPVAGDHAAVSAAVLAWIEDTTSALGGRESEEDLGWVTSGSTVVLAWVKVQASCLINIRAFLTAPELRVHYGVWTGILKDINAITTPNLGTAMQICGLRATSRRNKWLHMILQETYVRMAITGVGTGLAIAAFVLFLSTANIIVAALCITTIALVLVCVLATIVAMGWQLGEAESLSMMILTGFAVDYVVHLAHSYMESDEPNRIDRVHDALRDMGISVFWGMLTSFIAAVVLASLQLQFFSKFGIFFLLTIVYAYFWAVCFLMPVLAFVGPQGGGGKGVKSVTASIDSSIDSTPSGGKDATVATA